MHIEIKQNAVIPTNDYVFKKIFGQVGNENITKDFLSTILDKTIESVNLEGNTILEKDLFDEKIGILDIKAKLDNQVLCDIEMQVVNHRNIEKRILFYWSKLYSSTIKSGKNYDKLNKTICILIANYELSNLKEILKGHTEWKIREKDFKNTVLTDMLEIHIIELPKIQKLMQKGSFFKEDADFFVWTKFLLMPNELGVNEMSDNNAVKKAKEELDKIQNDEYEQRLAELRLKHILDTNSIESYGYEKGLAEGEAKGKIETQKEIAKKLIEKGIPLENISEITGLSKEELENL